MTASADLRALANVLYAAPIGSLALDQQIVDTANPIFAAYARPLLVLQPYTRSLPWAWALRPPGWGRSVQDLPNATMTGTGNRVAGGLMLWEKGGLVFETGNAAANTALCACGAAAQAWAFLIDRGFDHAA